MKMRFSMIVAMTGLALPVAAFAAEQPEASAESIAKWNCVLNNECDGEVTVGEGIEGETARPLIALGETPKASTTVAKSPAKSGAAQQVRPPRQRLTSAEVAPAAGRGFSGGSVTVPDSVKKRANLVVTFKLGSAALENTATDDLRGLATVMASSLQSGTQRKIRIAGHTDATGTDSVNEKLSRDRAEAVRKALVDLGIPADNVEAVGMGSAEPIDGYAPTHGINRRVEVVLVN
jgi:outer membrane protein OmpA-like peptidoglycan-associated protein